MLTPQGIAQWTVATLVRGGRIQNLSPLNWSVFSIFEGLSVLAF
jgi:hypothetical protein